jgi:streptogramin lyase
MYNPRRSNLNLMAFHSVAFAGAAIGLSVLTTGCAGNMPSDFGVPGSSGSSSLHLTGKVYGGQQPVSGSSIQLYTVGTSGLKSASTAILTTAVTTDANGNFSISGDYSCAGATQVYITASGGNPGAGTNGSLTLAAALGSCATLLANANTTFITMDEVTTVAMAYALAPFASSLTSIGASGSSPTGLVNAFANAALLANTTSGTSGGANLAAGVIVPTTELNTLADILAACVNTDGGSSTACTSLFAATGASDTFGAALAIAKNPGNSTITALSSLVSAQAPFQPSVSVAPNDFTLAVTMGGNSTLSTPYAIAIDAAGNVWVANESGSTVTEFSTTGGVLATPAAAGLIGAQGIALDRSGNVWVANTAGNSVIEFTAASNFATSSSYTAGGIYAPSAIAVDSAGTAWVANFDGNSVTGLRAGGTAVSGSPFAGNTNITVPSGIALDSSGNVYVTSGTNGSSVVKLSNAGSYISTFTDNALQGPVAVAIDPSEHVLVTGFTTGTSTAGALSEFSSAGVATPPSPLASTSVIAGGVASDGTSLWVANASPSGGLTQFVYAATSGSGPTGGYGSLNVPVGVAVDPSGSVWTTDSGSNMLSKFIGIAAPVTTPLAANVGP